MTRWADVEQAQPDFAKRVQALFDAGRHKTMATIRKDGSPRISGIECGSTERRDTKATRGHSTFVRSRSPVNPEATRLVVEWWTPDRGHQQIERD